MSNIATGVAKKVRFLKELVWGILAAGVGQAARRVSSDLSLSKDTFESKEIREDYQVADMRHGMRKVEGKIDGELSPKSYAPFLASACRRDFTAGASSAGADIAAIATGFLRTVGSFLTDGHTVGSVVRAAGYLAGGVANNTRNFLVTAVSEFELTGVFVDGSSMVATAAGDAITITAPGKVTYAPLTGHTADSYSIEHWHEDIAQSELFVGCKVNGISIDLPPTGMSKIAIDFVGRDMQGGVVAAIANPTAAPTTGVLAAVNGLLYANGVQQTALTGLKFSLNGNMSTDPVVGSNLAPDIFEGRVTVKGEMTVFFEDAAMREAFEAETEVTLFAVFTSSDAKDADFVAFTLPRVKLSGASKDDGEKGLVQSVPFVALLGSGAAGFPATTIWIQDSAVTA